MGLFGKLFKGPQVDTEKVRQTPKNAHSVQSGCRGWR